VYWSYCVEDEKKMQTKRWRPSARRLQHYNNVENLVKMAKPWKCGTSHMKTSWTIFYLNVIYRYSVASSISGFRQLCAHTIRLFLYLCYILLNKGHKLKVKGVTNVPCVGLGNIVSLVRQVCSPVLYKMASCHCDQLLSWQPGTNLFVTYLFITYLKLHLLC